MPEPHHSIFFTGRMPFLPPNQQRQIVLHERQIRADVSTKQTDLFLVCISQHLDALQINNALQTLLCILRLLFTTAAVLADTDAAAQQDQRGHDRNADHCPERN